MVSADDATPPGAPPTRGTAGKAEAVLSRELSDFLIELSIAIHKHSMYPEGHPSLVPAAVTVTDRVNQLLTIHGSLSLGVARAQLIIEGVATDEKNPVLGDLARRLHRHHLGAITFTTGVTPREIQEFLGLVAQDAERGTGPLGLGDAEKRQQQPNIQLYPVAYDRLHLVGEDPDDDEVSGEERTRFAQLWVGLARAAISVADDDADADAGDKPSDHDPAMVAKAISEHGAEGGAYDQVIVGYLLQIADELKTAGGSDALALKKRIGKMVSALDAPTLDRLVEMGGDRQQRRRFLMNAANGMDVDAVLKLVEAAGSSEEDSISDRMLRMLRKMAQHAQGDGGYEKLAEQNVREQVGQLITGWSLKDPNPDAYTGALDAMASSEALFQTSPEQVHHAEAKRIVQMALEIDVTGDTVENAIHNLLHSDDAKWLLDTVANAGSSSVLDAAKGRIKPEELIEVLQRDRLDPEMLYGLQRLIGSEAATPMLEALISSESVSTRKVLLDHLVEMGEIVAPVAMMHLNDPRWYVQRNMLCILGELTEKPDGFKADDFLQHEDPRVRREALRIMFKWPATRDRGIAHALADPDEGLVRLALGAAAERCPKAAVPLVVSRASSGAMDTRLAAIRVLGAVDDSSALQALLLMTQPIRKLFRWKHPKKTQAYIAALKALSRHADKEPVRNVLKLASRRRDPHVAAAVRGLVFDEETQVAPPSGNGDATEAENEPVAEHTDDASAEDEPVAEHAEADPSPDAEEEAAAEGRDDTPEKKDLG